MDPCAPQTKFKNKFNGNTYSLTDIEIWGRGGTPYLVWYFDAKFGDIDCRKHGCYGLKSYGSCVLGPNVLYLDHESS